MEAMESSLVERLEDELESFGISFTREQTENLLKHLTLLEEKNKVLNLTRIVDMETAVTLHVVDSLLPLACEQISLNKDSLFLDIGTGGGFPGVPLGIMTGAKGVLVDSIGKKVSAVNDFLGALGLTRLQGRHIRVEDLAREVPATFGYVFARAVAQTNVLIEYASPLLKNEGILVVQKGRPEDSEIEAATRAAEICGMRMVSRETFELPHELGHREILTYKKVSKPRIKLPRRNGQAKSEPLGL